ncbi:unnamed protein product [Rotaria sp. Silwood1]|nr:unnamed protein product [Rotaria sp. Silwood1]CAF1595515.1 unnamed protein product [Rotaria sp. Silwood1]CAF3673284.1 unnamed protein product [Rotaria sp. Silwood1]CAF3702123.1 unnamed protein product [Rotaria sp. Silwood1]CAF4692421.1 unnamed protein product [Rotaria sp. Silwood1]
MDVVNMFEIILKNYLDFIDTNQFIDIIADRYACKNSIVFGSFFESFAQEDTLDAVRKISFKARQQKYYRILDQLSSSKRISTFLKNELSLSSNNNNNVIQIVANFCGLILIMVLRILSGLNVKLLDIELRKYQNTLFIPFITFIDTHFVSNQCSQNNILIKDILEFLHKTSDQTLTIPIFINANCPQVCLRWLSLPYLNAYEYAYILRIIYNIARHDEGVIILNKYQCHNILMQFNTDILNKQIDFIIDKKWCEDLQLIYFMIIILIVDSNELVTESTNWFITYRLSPAIFNGILLRTYRHQKFHISELMIILVRLCTNDNFIHCIFHKNYCTFPQYVFNVLNFLLHCVEIERFDYSLLSLDVLTVIALANILWSISFHDQYKNILIENILIINRLAAFESSDIIEKILPNMYIPRHMSSLKRAIDGIWENVYPSSSTDVEIDSSTKTKSFCSLMISYSHMDIDFCRQLYNVFSILPELSVSVDFNNSKYLWKDIAQTIEQSDLVLFLISNNFFNSKSCRQELIYVTDRLKKPFISVFINGDYQVTGWLKNRISESKQIRFEERDFIDTCKELLLLIKQSLSMSMTLVKNTSNTKQWNAKEVKQWFNNNNLMSELHDFYQFQNGYELLLYAQAILAFSWTKEYERIKIRFEEKFKEQQQYLSPHEFLKFINALTHLKSKNLHSI